MSVPALPTPKPRRHVSCQHLVTLLSSTRRLPIHSGRSLSIVTVHVELAARHRNDVLEKVPGATDGQRGSQRVS